MTEPTTPDATPAKPARKTPAKKTATKPEFAPTVVTTGTGRERLDHANCGHPRDFKGRTACRAAYAKAAK